DLSPTCPSEDGKYWTIGQESVILGATCRVERGWMSEPDAIDHAILEVLRRDARTSMTAVAEQVHISRAGAHARVKRLTDHGVITGYTVRTDPVLLGHHASAYVMLAIEQATWQEVRDRLQAIP